MKKLNREEKIKDLTNFLRNVSTNENLFIKPDEIKGNTFAITERKAGNTIDVKSNFMTYEEMNCYFFGVLAVKENRIQFDSEIKEAIYWSVSDFEDQAKNNFEELKKYNPNEFKHLENWEQFYDKKQFPAMLKAMINNHESDKGINWHDVDYYVGLCEIKNQ